MFCKITYRKDTVYLQGKQCHLWSKYRQANCVWRHLHPASSTLQKSSTALFSNFNHFCHFRYSAWKTAVSGILLLNTLLTLFKCSIWKVHLNEEIFSSMFSEPHNVYNVLSDLPRFLLSSVLTSDFCFSPQLGIFIAFTLPWRPTGRTGFPLLWSIFLAYSLLHTDRGSPNFFPWILHIIDVSHRSIFISNFQVLFAFVYVCVWGIEFYRTLKTIKSSSDTLRN